MFAIYNKLNGKEILFFRLEIIKKVFEIKRFNQDTFLCISCCFSTQYDSQCTINNSTFSWQTQTEYIEYS